MLLKLVFESVLFAYGSLKGDRFRTFLSLFGVSIGIFSIVTVFTAIDALQKNVSTGLSGFGGSTLYIQQFPWEPADGIEYKWWEYIRRPSPKIEEFNFLKSRSKTSEAIAFVAFSEKTIRYKRNSFSGGFIAAPTSEWSKISNVEMERGRYFSTFEAHSSIPVVVLGSSVAEALFAGEDPENKIIKVGNSTARVVGVLKKAGESIVSIFDTDNSVTVPYNYGATLFNVRNSGTLICIKPLEQFSRDEFLQEIKMLMRSVRRLKPSHADNFALNEMTFLLKQTKTIFRGINLAGWIIGGFSILIGGFGIANIMFVSVKERTPIIGIQKALGAKRYMILTQFLTEAALLALAGGVIGLLMVLGIVLLTKGNDSFPMELSFYNIVRGLLISSVIGIVSGFVPAYKASKLNPVDAINAK